MPSSMTRKFTPHSSATRAASRQSRRVTGPCSATATVKHQRTDLRSYSVAWLHDRSRRPRVAARRGPPRLGERRRPGARLHPQRGLPAGQAARARASACRCSSGWGAGVVLTAAGQRLVRRHRRAARAARAHRGRAAAGGGGGGRVAARRDLLDRHPRAGGAGPAPPARRASRPARHAAGAGALGHRRPGGHGPRRPRARPQLGRPAADRAVARAHHRRGPRRRRRARAPRPPAGRARGRAARRTCATSTGWPPRAARSAASGSPGCTSAPARRRASCTRPRSSTPTSPWSPPGSPSRWCPGWDGPPCRRTVAAVPVVDPVPERTVTALHRRSMDSSPAVQALLAALRGRRRATTSPAGAAPLACLGWLA